MTDDKKSGRNTVLKIDIEVAERSFLGPLDTKKKSRK